LNIHGIEANHVPSLITLKIPAASIKASAIIAVLALPAAITRRLQAYITVEKWKLAEYHHQAFGTNVRQFFLLAALR
jgi:hypothetical protein